MGVQKGSRFNLKLLKLSRTTQADGIDGVKPKTENSAEVRRFAKNAFGDRGKSKRSPHPENDQSNVGDCNKTDVLQYEGGLEPLARMVDAGSKSSVEVKQLCD